MVGVDGSASSRAALRFAAEEARIRGAALAVVMAEGVELEDLTSAESAAGGGDMMSLLAMLTAAPATDVAMKVTAPLRLSGRDRRLKRIVADELGLAPTIPLDLEVWDGGAARVLTDRSASAGVMVVGTRGHGGFPGLRLGSVAQQVVHRGSCPVIVVRHWPRHRIGEEGAPLGRVVAGFDARAGLSRSALAVLSFGAKEARMRSASLEVLVVRGGAVRGDKADQAVPSSELSEAADLIRQHVGNETDDSDLQVDVVVRVGNVVEALIDSSMDATLLVLGSGHDWFAGLEPGSVRHQVVHYATCPVAVVRPPRPQGSGAGST